MRAAGIWGLRGMVRGFVFAALNKRGLVPPQPQKIRILRLSYDLPIPLTLLTDSLQRSCALKPVWLSEKAHVVAEITFHSNIELIRAVLNTRIANQSKLSGFVACGCQ